MYDYVSTESNVVNFINAHIAGVDAGYIKFSSTVPAVCDVHPKKGLSPTQMLHFLAKNVKKGSAKIVATCPSGVDAFKQGVGVYKEKKGFYRLYCMEIDNTTARTGDGLAFDPTDEEVAELANRLLSQAVVAVDVNEPPGGTVAPQPADTYDTNGNKTLDVSIPGEPDTAEEARVTALCPHQAGRTRIIYVHALQISIRVTRDAAAADRSFFVNAGAAGLLSPRTYQISQSGSTFNVTVTRSDTRTGEIHLSAPIGTDLAANNAVVLKPVSGLRSGLGGQAIIYVTDNSKAAEENLLTTIAHEIGHDLCGWKDLDILDHLMYRGVWGKGPQLNRSWIRFRKLPIKNGNDPADNENQWDAVPRP